MSTCCAEVYNLIFCNGDETQHHSHIFIDPFYRFICLLRTKSMSINLSYEPEQVVIFVLSFSTLLTFGGLIYLLWRHQQPSQVANRKRENQGLHECEVLCEDSLERTSKSGDYQWKKCKKNPGHYNFTPIEEFTMSHLAPPFRTPEVMEMIRNLAARTVRLRVHKTSWNRPSDCPFYEFRNKAITHFGSGWISEVVPSHGPCRCKICKSATNDDVSSSNIPWWRLKIHTANHVVYDNDEAEETEVDIFCDNESSETDGRMITLQGLSVISCNQGDDLCRFWCATHDAELVDLLKKFVATKKTFENVIPVVNDDERLCVAISHPHGRFKHISIGSAMGTTNLRFTGDCSYKYSTGTCRGSSGGPIIVQVVHKNYGDKYQKKVVTNNNDKIFTHSVACVVPHSRGSLKSGLNKSSVGSLYFC